MLFLEKRLKEKQAGDDARNRDSEAGKEGDLLDFITPRNREIMEKKIASLCRKSNEPEE